MHISIGTIIRTVCLALALVNQILSATGHAVLPIEDEQLETLLTTGATVVTALISWWKNNSFTSNALRADAYLARLRGKEEA